MADKQKRPVTSTEPQRGDAEPHVPRPGPDTEAYPGERNPDEDRPGSQTGRIGGGGLDAHNPSPTRATGTDDMEE
jgi:hypothetical protein